MEPGRMPHPAARNALPDVGAPEDKDPVVIHAPTRKSIACFGAVSLHTGKFVRSVSIKFDAKTFEAFLKKAAAARPKKKKKKKKKKKRRRCSFFKGRNFGRVGLWLLAAWACEIGTPCRERPAGIAGHPAPPIALSQVLREQFAVPQTGS